jgi:hypothetical protein
MSMSNEEIKIAIQDALAAVGRGSATVHVSDANGDATYPGAAYVLITHAGLPFEGGCGGFVFRNPHLNPIPIVQTVVSIACRIEDIAATVPADLAAPKRRIIPTWSAFHSIIRSGYYAPDN